MIKKLLLSFFISLLPTAIGFSQLHHFSIGVDGGGNIPTQTAGIPFFIEVLAKDSINNTITSFDGTVDITSSAVLAIGGGTTSSFINGVLSSHQIKFTTAGNFTLTATKTSGIETGTSNTFTVNPGTQSKILVESAADGSGTIIAEQDIVAGNQIIAYAITRDTMNNFVENTAADAWSLQNITGDIIQSDLVAGGEKKSATFTGHQLGTAQIRASYGVLNSIYSDTLTVVAGSATQLKFIQQPTNGIAGAIISPPITIQLKDTFNNNVVTFGDTVIITLPPDQGTLSGTLQKLTDTTGKATFNDLSINQSGTKTLIANSFGLKSDTSVQFTLDTYTITATAGTNGSISPSGAVDVSYGGSQTFTITPNTGYHVDSVIVDGSYVGAVTSYPFTNVTANHTISAKFAIDQFTVTASAGPHGTIIPSGTVNVNYGNSISFAITADPDYHIDSVIVDGISQGPIAEYTFSMITSAHSIRAIFAADIPVVNLKIFLEGAISGDTMRTTLQTVLPSDQPYNTTPWNYAGSEHLDNIPVDVVDWIIIELRSGISGSTKIGTHAALIKQNGTVIDTNGKNSVAFPNIPVGNYYVVVRHRNHIAVMSAALVLLSDSSTLYDFTIGPDKYYGTDAKNLGNMKFGMYSGDYSTDGYIDGSDFIGPDNERYQSGYKRSDLNMDGYVDGSDFIHPDNNKYKDTNIPE